MRNFLLFIFFSFSLTFISISAISVASETDSLVLLHVLFRHGNRTPESTETYATDPYANNIYYPYGRGQLTTKGKSTAYGLGTFVNNRYKKFLGSQYTKDTLVAKSTNYKRTKMTLELFLAALFPPTNLDVFNKGLNWQPIPYLYDAGVDILVPDNCLNWVNDYYSYITSEEGQAIINEYKGIYKALSQYTGQNIRSPIDVITIYMTLIIQEDNGLKLPSWTADYYPDLLREISRHYYDFRSATTNLQKLNGGLLMQKILNDTSLKINGGLPEDRKLYVYSVHDLNIASIFHLFEHYYPYVPPYGTVIMFEVHKINGIYGFKIFYNDRLYTHDSAKQILLPGCASFCPIDQFIELLQENLPTPSDICFSTSEH